MRLRNLFIGGAAGGLLGFAAATLLLRPDPKPWPAPPVRERPTEQAAAPAVPEETTRAAEVPAVPPVVTSEATRVAEVPAAPPIPTLLRVPAGTVTLPGGPTASFAAFRIGRKAVSNAQFRAFVEAAGDPTEGEWRAAAAVAGDDAPVAFVRYDDAAAYAGWAGLRLPTEVETRAAQAGGWFDRSPVDAWEWTSTWYDRYPGSREDDRHFGTDYRVILRPSGGPRNFYRPDAQGCDVGFRCASGDAPG